MRGCDLDHPYHQVTETNTVVVPDGFEAPRAARTYQLPDEEELAAQPSQFLTPNDMRELENGAAHATDCLIHPPAYDTPVNVDDEDLSQVKMPRAPRKKSRREDDDDLGEGARASQQGTGYPR